VIAWTALYLAQGVVLGAGAVACLPDRPLAAVTGALLALVSFAGAVHEMRGGARREL
jgi:hypothetical protein